eukprot:scaffold11_cov257-Pinguiococcus_pyrenoidosus.AAC.16
MSRVRARSKLAILCLSVRSRSATSQSEVQHCAFEIPLLIARILQQIYAARGFDFATYFEKQAQDRGHGYVVDAEFGAIRPQRRIDTASFHFSRFAVCSCCSPLSILCVVPDHKID